LLAIKPTGKNDQRKPPRLQNKYLGVSVVMQIQDNHWRGPKCKTAWPILCVIEACRRAGENDLGTLADASAPISSNNIDRWQSIKSHVFAVLLARLRFWPHTIFVV